MDDQSRWRGSLVQLPFFVDSCIAEGKWEFDQDESVFFGEALEINFQARSRCFEFSLPRYSICVVLMRDEAQDFLKRFRLCCVVRGYDFYPHIVFLIDVLSS